VLACGANPSSRIFEFNATRGFAINEKTLKIATVAMQIIFFISAAQG
jgi:hypothetical protein